MTLSVFVHEEELYGKGRCGARVTEVAVICRQGHCAVDKSSAVLHLYFSFDMHR